MTFNLVYDTPYTISKLDLKLPRDRDKLATWSALDYGPLGACRKTRSTRALYLQRTGPAPNPIEKPLGFHPSGSLGFKV